MEIKDMSDEELKIRYGELLVELEVKYQVKKEFENEYKRRFKEGRTY